MNTPLPLDAAARNLLHYINVMPDADTLLTPEVLLAETQLRAALSQPDTLAARVAELEGELAVTRKYADDCAEMLTRAVQERDATHIHANALRDALQDCFEWFDARADVDHVGDPMRPFPNAEAIQREHVLAALASTPAASLAAHDAEVLERARVALNDADADCECGNISAITTDNVIRALAAQAATHSVPGGTSEVKP